MSRRARAALEAMGLPSSDLNELPTSSKRFPDGRQYRIEIPSTEGPEGIETVVTEAERLHVPIHRVSQGSGVLLFTDAELDEMVKLGADAGIEVALFARPNAGWAPSAMSSSDAGAVLAPTARGQDQLRHCINDIERAARHGIRSVLIGDIGVLAVFAEMRRRGDLPPDMTAKISVMLPAANPATAQVLASMGAGSLNLPTDLSLSHIAGIRAAVDIPLDIYIEAPGNLGGFLQNNLIPEIIRVAAPVYLKFGLRNGPDIYPTGAHMQTLALDMSRERVRRARLGLELLERSGVEVTMSSVNASDLAVPIVSQPVGLN